MSVNVVLTLKMNDILLYIKKKKQTFVTNTPYTVYRVRTSFGNYIWSFSNQPTLILIAFINTLVG